MVDNAIKSTNKCEYRATSLHFRNRFYSCEFKTKKLMFIEKKKISNDVLIQNGINYELRKLKTTRYSKTNKMLVHWNDCKTAVFGSKV